MLPSSGSKHYLRFYETEATTYQSTQHQTRYRIVQKIIFISLCSTSFCCKILYLHEESQPITRHFCAVCILISYLREVKSTLNGEAFFPLYSESV
jgi:hypothetical protein